MTTTFFLTLSLACLLLVACASRQPRADVAGVRVLPQNSVIPCKKSGTAEVTTRTSFAIWTLYPADVKAHLVRRAQIKAAQAGADTVIPLSPPDNGKQTFALYDCRSTVADRQQANTPGSQMDRKRKNAATVKTTPYKPPFSL
jgi:hypothetical protein